MLLLGQTNVNMMQISIFVVTPSKRLMVSDSICMTVIKSMMYLLYEFLHLKSNEDNLTNLSYLLTLSHLTEI